MKPILHLLMICASSLNGTAHAAASTNNPNNDLIFVPVQPCRLVDTRASGAGDLVAGVPQAFLAYGNVASQGGNAAGCPQPKKNGGPLPVAMSANITAVGPSASANGLLKAFGAGASSTRALPLLYYTKGANIANAATIALCKSASCPGGKQLSLLSLSANVRALVDVLGYFYPKDTNILTVATDGGDFASPATAIAYLKALNPPPSATKPWVIKIDPGVYDLDAKPLVLDVPHVSVQGAGPAATFLTGKGLTVTAGATAVRDLSITAVGWGGAFSAVQAGFTGGSLTLSNLEVDASGGTNNTALLLTGSSIVQSKHCVLTASGGTAAYGARTLEGSSLALLGGSSALAKGGTANTGLLITDDSSVTISGSQARAAGSQSVGLRYHSSQDASVISAIVDGNVTGVSSAGTATLRIDQSSIDGGTDALSVTSGSVLVGLSKIAGPVSGPATCVDTYDAGYSKLKGSCKP